MTDGVYPCKKPNAVEAYSTASCWGSNWFSRLFIMRSTNCSRKEPWLNKCAFTHISIVDRGWHMQHTPRAKLKGKGLHHDVLYVTMVLYSTRSDVRNYVASVLIYLFIYFKNIMAIFFKKWGINPRMYSTKKKVHFVCDISGTHRTQILVRHL